MNTKIWYAAHNSNDTQGLVCDEKTGANIAVTYDAQDANLVAAAPELLDALERADQRIVQLCKMVCWISNNPKKVRIDDFTDDIRPIIAKAKGGES